MKSGTLGTTSIAVPRAFLGRGTFSELWGPRSSMGDCASGLHRPRCWAVACGTASRSSGRSARFGAGSGGARADRFMVRGGKHVGDVPAAATGVSVAARGPVGRTVNIGNQAMSNQWHRVLTIPWEVQVKSVDLDLSMSGESAGEAVGPAQSYAGTRPVAVHRFCAKPTLAGGKAAVQFCHAAVRVLSHGAESWSCAPIALARCAQSHSTPIPRPCATPSSTSVSRPRHPAWRRPGASRCRTCPMAGRVTSPPTPSRHRSTNSTNASLDSCGTPAPGAPIAPRRPLTIPGVSRRWICCP